jgi:hypothetical protein
MEWLISYLKRITKYGLATSAAVALLYPFLIGGKTALVLFLEPGSFFTENGWARVGIGILNILAVGVIADLVTKREFLIHWVLKRIPKPLLDDPLVEWEVAPNGTRAIGILRSEDTEWAYVMEFNGWPIAFTFLSRKVPISAVYRTAMHGSDLILYFATFGTRGLTENSGAGDV